MYDVDDLLDLASRLDPRRRKVNERPRAVGAAPTEALGGSSLPAPVVLPGVSNPVDSPPPSVPADAFPVVRTASEFQTSPVPMLKPPKVQNMPMPGEEQTNDARVRLRLDAGGGFSEGGDLNVRPRVADPLEFAATRLRERQFEPPAKSRHSRLYEMGAGAWRGFARGGLGGAIVGAAQGGLRPDDIAQMRQQEQLGRDRNAYLDLYKMQKAQTELAGEEISNAARAATIPYLLARPGLEEKKIANKAEYDAWRMTSGNRKQDSAESYIAWRMANGDRRAATAEGQLELRAEYIREIQPAQFDRRQGETERRNKEMEGQGRERIKLFKEGLRLRQYLGEGSLDARWAGIAQGYDRMGAAQQKQVDALSEKAAKATAEADYFDSTAANETDAAKKATAAAAAKMKRDEANALHRQAEGIQNRPAPQVSRPTAAPPISEEDFVNDARQRMGSAFNEAQARAAWRRRYGR